MTIKDNKASRLLVIGVGNRFRCDDGVGPVVAVALRRHGLDATELAGEGAELMEVWSGRERVIVVDAACSGAAPGTVRRFDAAAEEPPAGYFHYSTHQFSVAEAVETSRALNRLPQSLVLYGIEGAEFSFGQGLTPEVAAAGEAVVKEIAMAALDRGPGYGK